MCSNQTVYFDNLDPLLGLVLQGHILFHLPDQGLLVDAAGAGLPPGDLQLDPAQLKSGQTYPTEMSLRL